MIQLLCKEKPANKYVIPYNNCTHPMNKNSALWKNENRVGNERENSAKRRVVIIYCGDESGMKQVGICSNYVHLISELRKRNYPK